MNAKPSKLKSTKVLVVFAWSVFQQGSGFRSAAPKLDHVIKALRLMPGLKLSFLTHVESARPFVSSYGWHFLSRLAYLPLLLIAVLASFPATLGSEAHEATLKYFWHEVRVKYWILILRIRRFDFIVGSNLTVQQITASKSLGVKTIEIQHGLLNESWYRSNWAHFYPDYLACWSNTSLSLLSDLGVLPVQIPYPPIQSNLRGKDSPPRRDLLVALGWGRSSSIDGLGAMSEEMFNVLRNQQLLADSVVIRIHPVFPRREVRRLKTFLRSHFPSAKIEYSSTKSAGQSVLEAQIIIVEGSTLVEALLADKTLICCSTETYVRARIMARDLGVTSRIFLSQAGEISENSIMNDNREPKGLQIDWKQLESVVLKSSTQ